MTMVRLDPINEHNETSNQASTRNVYFVSLGCSKNLVDSQVMLGRLGQANYQVTQNVQDAEVIIINTCSFIDAAKEESINMILDLADYKKKDIGMCKALVVSGCLAQRYYEDLEREIPEVDLFIGTGEYNKIDQFLSELEAGTLKKKSFVDIPKFIHTELDPRINTSPFYTYWLKISEGCNRNCTFCIIPKLRGRLRSRSVESLIAEAKNAVSTGVKELNLISQDLSDYGVDLPESDNLLELLNGLSNIEQLKWIRLFYFYPDELTEEVMDLIAEKENICKYLDMPIQHFSDSVLKRMNRKITGDEIRGKVKKLREKIPGIILRTSVIVGFPGETEEDFNQLKTSIKELEFEHLGVFKYSDEQGTPAFNLKNKVPRSIIDDRYAEIYEIQKEIVQKRLQKMLGKTYEVLIEGPHEETDLLLQGRFVGQAPDIDGKIVINDGIAQIGEFVKVEITDILDYDLIGKII